MHKVEVVYPQGRPAESPSVGRGDGHMEAPPPPKYQTLFGAALNEKPEHMTHLKGNTLVFKDHPRIAFRGWIDLLEAEITLAQLAAEGEGYHALAEELEEVLAFVRQYIRFDVLDEPVGEIRLCGYTPEQLREYSHYPEKHFGAAPLPGPLYRRTCNTCGKQTAHIRTADGTGGLCRIQGCRRQRDAGRYDFGAEPALLP